MAEQARRINIVQAQVQHVPLVAPLFDTYRQFYHQPPDLAGAHTYLTDRLERTESVIFLALRYEDSSPTHQLVGFTQLYPSFSSIAMRHVWILYDLYVVPEARRLGVGRALLDRARLYAASTGAVEMSLQTALDNLPAQALYSSAGWQRDNEYLTYLLRL